MRKFIKKNRIQIITSFFAFMLLEIIFILVLKFYPFKKASLLISDLYYEYAPFYNYMREAILSGRSILSSFSFTLGQSMVGIISYYCLSPLNLVLLFSNINNITYFIKLLILIKFVLSALNMSIYLKDKTSDEKNIIFSLIYAFITYSIKYSFNIMWMDVVLLLPLAILGVEKLINGQSKKLYLIVLTIMIFSNFYMAYSTCIFIFIYFLYYSLIKKKLTWKLFLQFCSLSIIAVLLDAFMLLPTIFNMLGGKFINTNSSYSSFVLYNPLNLIYNFTPGKTAGNQLVDLPYFYVTSLVLVLVINYLFNKDIPFKERILSLSIILFYIFATLIAPIDLFLHCFRVPNCLYYRYIYVLSFFFISIVSRNKIKINWYSLIPIFILSGWALLVESNLKMIIFSALLLIYFFSLKFNLKYLTIFIVTIELFFNMTINFKTFNGVGEYNEILKYKEVIQNNLPNKNEFYRIELDDPLTINDNFIIGNYGINSFSPTTSNESRIFLKDYLHIAERRSMNYIYQNRNILDPYLLGIKYEVSNDKLIENKNYLPLIIKSDNLNYFKPSSFILENENNIYKMINGINFYEEIPVELDCIKDNIIIKKECQIKYNKEKDKKYYLEIYNESGFYDILDGKYLFEANQILEINDSLILKKENVYFGKFKLFAYNESSIVNQENNFEVFKDDYIKLNVKKGTYFTTIPYDKGWHIKQNGVELKKIKVLDSLIGFEADEGSIEIKYIPQGLILGIVISCVTLVLIVIYRMRRYKYAKNKIIFKTYKNKALH